MNGCSLVRDRIELWLEKLDREASSALIKRIHEHSDRGKGITLSKFETKLLAHMLRDAG